MAVCWGGSDAEEVEYFAVFMEGKKIGHAIQSRVVADGKVTTTQEASLTISRAGISVTMNMTERSVETAAGKPLSFESVQDMSIGSMKVSGTIDEAGKVTVTATVMGTEQKSTLDWPSGALMAEGLRLLQEEKGLKEGTTYTAKVFSPGMLQALDARIVVGSKENVDLLGRVVSLTKVESAMVMPGMGEIVSTGYVDEDLRMLKTIMPLAQMQVEMLACTKEFALGANDVLDLVNKLFLKSPQPLGDVGSAESITYHLTPAVEGGELKIPSTDNQTVRGGKAGAVAVTVKPVAGQAGGTYPYKGKDEGILEALKPNRYVQSDDKRIIDLARKAVGGTKDAAEAAKKIEAFVADYVEDKNLSVGYASAAEVAVSKQGDCSEHAVLTAAMCQAVGIPAQVAVGIVYVEEWAGLKAGFGGHAWTEVYVGDKWVGLDAAFKGSGRGGYGPGHITLAVGNGEPADFFSLVNIMGQFKIEKVVINKAK
jgi:hypothetical protein